MTIRWPVRPPEATEWRAVEDLYPAAFPGEDLLPLVRALFACEDCRNLVVAERQAVLGHAAFTLCGVGDQARAAALLGPVAVAPSHHGQGLGTALIKAGFEHLAAARVSHVLVLGDPAYYSRFGFTAEREIATPCPIPDEWAGAWQSVRLLPDKAALRGVLRVPEPWLDPALWA